MRKTLKIIFTVSLLLNLVLIGVGAGAAYKMRANFALSPQPVSTEVRQKLKRSMKENRAEMRPLFKQMKENKKELRTILTAEEFDASAYRKSMENILDVKDKVARQRAVSMEKVLAELSPSERQKISERFLKRMDGNHKRPSQRHRKVRPERN